MRARPHGHRQEGGRLSTVAPPKPHRPVWHHWQDGLFFARGEHGEVLIKKNADGGPGSQTVFRGTIPSAEWASIVTHVAGYTSDPDLSSRAIRDFGMFHAGAVAELAAQQAAEARQDDHPVPKDDEE